jgi:hypothetical protein
LQKVELETPAPVQGLETLRSSRELLQRSQLKPWEAEVEQEIPTQAEIQHLPLVVEHRLAAILDREVCLGKLVVPMVALPLGTEEEVVAVVLLGLDKTLLSFPAAQTVEPRPIGEAPEAQEASQQYLEATPSFSQQVVAVARVVTQLTRQHGHRAGLQPRGRVDTLEAHSLLGMQHQQLPAAVAVAVAVQAPLRLTPAQRPILGHRQVQEEAAVRAGLSSGMQFLKSLKQLHSS